MAISFKCPAGHPIKAADTAAGKRGRCPACSVIVTIPHLEPVIELKPERDLQAEPAGAAEQEENGAFELADPAPQAVPRRTGARAPQGGPRTHPAQTPTLAAHGKSSAPLLNPSKKSRHLYWLLLVVLIPLGWSTLGHLSQEEPELLARVTQMIQKHPELSDRIGALADKEGATLDDLYKILPNQKFDDALLPHSTWGHWGFAVASAVVFMAGAIFLFPAARASWKRLAVVGLITGTGGILLLLAFQWLAFHMPLFRGRGWITLLLDLIWLIGLSYRMALGEYGFLLSFLGFTAGVGFCEEACKALPLIFVARKYGFDNWRIALVWGLISGIGFGVSEGITYSSDYYNGLAGMETYLVRFVSCVGLHGIWAAAIGITIFRRQDYFRGDLHVMEWIWRTLQVVIVPMVLHGLYDTLLKQSHPAWALIVAVASFGWLAVQIERAERDFGEEEPQPAIAW